MTEKRSLHNNRMDWETVRSRRRGWAVFDDDEDNAVDDDFRYKTVISAKEVVEKEKVYQKPGDHATSDPFEKHPQRQLDDSSSSSPSSSLSSSSSSTTTSASPSTSSCTSTTTTRTIVDRFSTELMGCVLAFLTVEEVVLNCSLVNTAFLRVARSDHVWKSRFERRWKIVVPETEDDDHPNNNNNNNDDDKTNNEKTTRVIGDYYSAYQRAHDNPHDLWITHWDITYPNNGLLSATQRCRLYDDDSGRGKRHYPNNKSRIALSRAATFHRQLNEQQYNGCPTQHVTDLLFFNLTDPSSSIGQWELRQQLREQPALAQLAADRQEAAVHDNDDNVPPPPPPGGLDHQDPVGVAASSAVRSFDTHTTTNHSWHIVQFRNVDPYHRPMVVQIGAQRPECFAVFPSEMLLPPGACTFVTFGVTALGGSLAYAFEGLNTLRDGLPVAWSDHYTEEAHLPLCPFIVRYHFCPTPPVHWKAITSITSDAAAAGGGGTDGSGSSSLLDVLKRQNVPAHQTRVIRLSAHVHAHYEYRHLRQACCCRPSSTNRPSYYYLAPELWERNRDFARRLQSILVDRSKWRLSITDGDATPSPSLLSTATEDPRTIRLQNLCRLMEVIADGNLQGNTADVSILLYTAHCMIKSFLASPCTSQRLVRLLSQMESVIDNCYDQITVGGEAWIPWRISGCYRSRLCTDSVFRHRSDHHRCPDRQKGLVDGQWDDCCVEWKDEPQYLDTFRYLTHSPGQFCLGPQEDINHLGETVVDNVDESSSSSHRYYRSQIGNVTDVFMDNPVFAFQAGICMIGDPRSLSVHGIYDWIPHPGHVVRRPRFPAGAVACDQLPCGPPTASNIRWYVDGVLGESWGDTQALPLVPHSLHSYLKGVPPIGTGINLVSAINEFGAIVSLSFDDEEGLLRHARHDDGDGDGVDFYVPTGGANGPPPLPFVDQQPANDQPRPHRLLQLLWILGARVGLAISDEHSHSPVYVERTILIASQWVSVSFMAAPLFITLVGRHWHWIPTEPVHYKLHDDYTNASNEMRFLSDTECGFVAAMMCVFWLALARWTERNTCRDFFRVLQEHVTVKTKNVSTMRRFGNRLLLRYQRKWDSICPLFLQRKLYTPHWNTRSLSDLRRHIAHVKSRILPPACAHARTILPKESGVFGDHRDDGLEAEPSVNSSQKLLIGIAVALGSFCSTTPHFWLNLVTIFSCSISMGMSVSLQSLEKGRFADAANTGSMLNSFSVVTIVILAFLGGQLVGSSGGSMFLCEFIVTAVSLLLGGAGTISASAMESWCSFFVLSSAGFWGYLFGRVALLDGIRRRRGCHSTMMLSNAACFLALFWVLLFLFAKWATPAQLIVVEPSLVMPEGTGPEMKRYRLSKKLQ